MFGFLCPASGSTSSANITMAVCPHALSDPRAEVTLQESNQELRSQLAQSKQDFQALMEEFLVSEAAAYSLATELQKHKCGECKDIIESVLGDKLPFEEGKLAEKSTLAKKLRESNLLIQEQEQQLAYLRHKLQEGREVRALLSQHLNDLLTHNGSDDHQGQAFRQQLAEGYRLATHLAHILGPGNNEDKEDEKTQGTLTHRLGRDVPPTVEPPLPRACLEEYSWTCATDVGQSESCWTQSSSAVFCFQGLAVSSLADTPSQHTDPEDDGGVQDGLCCRLGRDVPPTVEPPLPRACLEEYSWTCATDVGQSESCWTQSSSAVFCFQGLAVSSLADTPSQHTDPEDDGGVQDGLCCRLGRDVPPTVEPPLPRACLEEYSWTCATDVGQSESCWTQSSSAVFCFQGLAVSSLADTPSQHTDPEDDGGVQDGLCCRLGRDVPPTVEPPLPRACLEEYSWTCATDVGQSESCWTQSSSAVFCFQGLAVSSLADTPSQHTDPEDDGGVQDGLCCRLGRDVPPTVEPPLPRACLEEYSWTCATDVGQSESCWTQSSSAVFCFQGLAVSSLADTPSQHTDPEDDGGVQDGLCCRLGRDVPPTVEPPLPRACLEEYSWTCATDVGQSESCWTQSSSAVFCFQGLAVSSLADTPSQHTDPEDDGGVQDGLCCRLGRDVPPTVEPPLPRACLEEYSWTCATDVGQSESCWTQSSSAVFCFQGLAVSSLADTPSQHTDPEDDGGVQDGLCCRLGRDVPPTVEPPLPRACLEEYSWTCATDVGQSESCWTQSSSAVFCFQGLAVSSLADTPSQHTDPEDDGGVQDGLCCRLGRDVPPTVEPPLPRACLEEYSWTCATDVGQSESCWTQSSSAVFCFQGLAVSSLADTPSQHTDPEDDGGVQDGLCCRLGRDVPPTVEPPLPRACLEEYSWTCATDVGQSESCWTQSSSAVFCFQGLAVSSLADTPSQHTDPEDDGGVQDGLCCRLGRDVPPTVEPPLPRACLEEYSWTCATDVGQSESCWTQSSSAVFCFQGLAVSSLADTPSQHTDPEDDGGVQDGLCCRLGRDVPPTVEPPLPRACLEEYSWTCATDVGQSESCWTQSSSAVFCFQGLAVSSLADTPSQHTDPEDDGGVQDGLCCRLGRDVPPTVEPPLPRACLEEYSWTCATDVGQSESCWTQSSSAVFCFQGLAVSSLADTPSQHTDPEDDGGVQDGLCCSLSSNLLYMKDNGFPKDAVNKYFFSRSIEHDLSSSYRPYSDSSLSFDRHEIFQTLDAEAPTLEAGHRGPLRTNWSFQRPELQASQTQLQPGTQVTSYLLLQLDQLDCGAGKARLGLCSTTWSFRAHDPFRNQWPLFQGLGFDASLRGKKPPKLEGDALEGSAALSAQKQKIIKRKLLFNKWRITCNFPSLQLRVLRYQDLWI
ncbi:NBPF family member NBPF26-like isoform X3 [Equus caballus]|uniref:NBPF family member NBPF26-like isoform X3 n=2 Tax=Equus caballus TaxID=9796 RepID=UPI0038B2827C